MAQISDNDAVYTVLDQLNGSSLPAVSTMKIFELANAANIPVHYADSNTWPSVSAALTGYSTSDIAHVAASIALGGFAVLPQNGNVSLNSWTGAGYVIQICDDSNMFTEMAISGGYNGGYCTEYIVPSSLSYANGTLTALLVTKYEDDGRAILANAGFANPKNLAAEISCPIVMTAGTVNWFNKVSDGDWKDWMTVSGNISGEGRYNVNLANVQGNGIKFTGNNNDFHGDVYTSGGKSNRSVINWSDSNANTFLHIGHSYRNDDRGEACMGGNPTFGGYEGVWVDKWDNRTITVGSLNRYSEIHLYNCHRGYLLSLTKVGTAPRRLLLDWHKRPRAVHDGRRPRQRVGRPSLPADQSRRAEAHPHDRRCGEAGWHKRGRLRRVCRRSDSRRPLGGNGRRPSFDVANLYPAYIKDTCTPYARGS